MPDWDAIIIGGGPAGLTAGIYLSRGNWRTLLLEKEVPGRGIFRTVLYFPYMIPLIAVGWIFRIFLDRDTGFFNIKKSATARTAKFINR